MFFVSGTRTIVPCCVAWSAVCAADATELFAASLVRNRRLLNFLALPSLLCFLDRLDDANEARRDFASTILPESLTNFMNQMQIKSVKGTVRVFLVTFDAYEEVVRPIVATTATLVSVIRD